MNSQAAFKTGLRRGLWDGIPFLTVILPFSLLFGVIAADSGLTLAQAMGMTMIVAAGAAQFSALALMQENAPLIVVALTALVVNLRMAIYSAGLVLHLGKAPFWQRALAAYGTFDQNYAMLDVTYGADSIAPWQERMGYYFGLFLLIAPPWYAGPIFGAIFGAKIPPELALDFALPLLFLAIIGPSIRTIPHLIAAIVSIICALCFTTVPYGLGLILATLIAIIAAVSAEILLEKRNK